MQSHAETFGQIPNKLPVFRTQMWKSQRLPQQTSRDSALSSRTSIIHQSCCEESWSHWQNFDLLEDALRVNHEYLLQRISIAMQRGNAAAVLATMGKPQLDSWEWLFACWYNQQLLRYPAQKPAHAPIGIINMAYPQQSAHHNQSDATKPPHRQHCQVNTLQMQCMIRVQLLCCLLYRVNGLNQCPGQLFNCNETEMPLLHKPPKVVFLKHQNHPCTSTSGDKSHMWPFWHAQVPPDTAFPKGHLLPKAPSVWNDGGLSDGIPAHCSLDV